jgi:UrcA family protein
MSFQSTQSLYLSRIAAASRHVALVTLAGAAVFASTSAHAGDAIARERAISYSDLNLANPTDTAVLYSRLRNAADTVCGEYDIRALRDTQQHAACAARALSDAIMRVNDSALTALHAGDKRIRVAQREARR